MSSKINSYFNVKRDALKTQVKRTKLSPDPLEKQPKSQKLRTESSPSSKALESTSEIETLVVKKSENPARPFQKTTTLRPKVLRATKSVIKQTKLVRTRLPAHKKFAHLVLEAGPSGQNIDSHEIPENAVLDVEPIQKPILASPAKALFKLQSPHASPQKPYQSASEILRSHNDRNKDSIILSASVIVTPSKDLRRTPIRLYSPRTTPVKAVQLSSPISKSSVIEAEEISLSLPLPFHMQTLFELFRACDQVVSTLHNRSEVCSFDKLRPAVQEIVRSDFSEKSVAKFSTVYHESYSFRWDKQLDKITKLQLNTYVLTLIPNLRNDRTQMAYDSPSKGHLVFTGTRLIQRRLLFHQALITRVKKAHKAFLMSKFNLSESEVPSDAVLRRWHPAFPLDTAVPDVEAAPLPPRPFEEDNKITSASEAVAAFRARALFREAQLCDKLCPEADVTKATPVIKSVAPVAPAKNLKGISESLLARVREREKKMQYSVLTRPAIPEVERLAYSSLPTTITQVWRELRIQNGRPIPLAQVVTRLAQSSTSGLSTDHAITRIEQLLDLMPDWLEKVSWAKPHLRLKNPDRPIKDVIDEVKEKVAAKGIF